MSQFFVKLMDFILKSNIYIALSASSVAYITLFLFNLPFNISVLAIIFFEFMLIYNYNRLTDKNEDSISVPDRLPFANKYTPIMIVISAVFFSYLLFDVFSVSKSAFILILIQTISGLAYSVLRVKKWFIIKNVSVGIVWAMTVLFVGLYYGIFNIALIFLYVIIFLEFLINTTIFDIKDIKGDRAFKIKTIPNTYGKKNTIHMAYIVNTVSFMVLIFGLIFNIFSQKYLLLGLLITYIHICLYLESQVSKKIYYGVLVDGEYLPLALIILLYGLI